MAIDTPARIAILGAGPIGLEAAIYARFLGYDVDIYDQGGVAEHIERWGHVRMFSPFSLNASTLGLAALSAQNPGERAPARDALLTGHEFVQSYLLPLSRTDLLADHLQLGTRVIGVARQGMLKDHPIDIDARIDAEFSLLLEHEHGERRATADVVVDTTGSYSTPRWMGSDGLPAIGERALDDRIHYHLPDVLGKDREKFAGSRTLVVGDGHSAATTVTALAQLTVDDAQTKVIWLTRQTQTDPIKQINNDALPARAALAEAANHLARTSPSCVRCIDGCTVHRLTTSSNRELEVEIEGQDFETVCVDQIVAHVGFRPDTLITTELPVQYCRTTEAPTSIAASLLQPPSDNSRLQPTGDMNALKTTEPRFFVLGSKSYGRRSHFLISDGHHQIRSLFSFLGDRADLDLYATVRQL